MRTKINGQDFYVPNDSFGYRFFPPALARTPEPQRMAVKKPANTFRIFLFGESAAMGDPDPSFGAGRYLQALLHERYPATDFEVICVAMTAINSHAILPIARECARRDGDLWIIYMGNNEMIGPFGASTVFGSRVPAISLVRANLAAKATRTGQLLENVMQHWGPHSAVPKTWEGLNMFKDHQVRCDDPNRLRAYENFKKNLADILRAGHSAGVPVILSTVGSNLKDCAPFASLHSAKVTESQKIEWDGWFQAGIAAQTSGDYGKALDQFTHAATLDSQYAELQFRMANCDLAMTNTVRALREFELARDEDTLDFRSDARVNQIIKDAADAQASRGVHFLDAAQMFAENSPDGIPGNELFYEHVHMNFAGNYLLGRAFAAQTATLLPKSILVRDQGEWASSEMCDRRLAVSLWDRARVYQVNFSRVSEPPFTTQLNDVPRARFYMAKLKQLGDQMNADARKQSRALYQNAVSRAEGDYTLHQNFAQFLSQIDDLPGAVKEERQFSELLPHTPVGPYKVGTLLVRQGKIDEAQKSFSRALSLRADYVPALNELGLIYANQMKTAEAAKCFSETLRINPGFVEAYLNWGFTDQCEGNIDQASARYHEAANLQPRGPAAYFFQAITLARQHQVKDSLSQFQAAVWMNPQFWQAHYLLGVELAEQNKVDEAQAQFAEVTRQRPDFAKAHLNYAVSLARQGKLQEAFKEFQVTLQLNPTNKTAQHNLEALQANLQALKARQTTN
ncbi:MAG TPA: tetratricopeptide repeat protein [Verrucomicrobiae bacterium]|nr:tetratricopeptide repeat protein [Verrucomicrobiae bacterium]